MQDEPLAPLEELTIGLPSLGIEHLSSGELPEVVLVDGDDDDSVFDKPLPDISLEPVSRVRDHSGDFTSDYETSIVTGDEYVQYAESKAAERARSRGEEPTRPSDDRVGGNARSNTSSNTRSNEAREPITGSTNMAEPDTSPDGSSDPSNTNHEDTNSDGIGHEDSAEDPNTIDNILKSILDSRNDATSNTASSNASVAGGSGGSGKKSSSTFTIGDFDDLDTYDDGTDDEDDDDYYDVYENGEADLLQEFNLDEVISDAIDLGASDVHISPDDVVSFTILGEIHRMDVYPHLTGLMTQRVEQKILTNALHDSFINELELDSSYIVRTGPHKGRRTRLSVGKSMGEIFLVFRIIADRMPTPQELGLSQQMVDWVNLPNGLVMINGPVGTGKSTTLASMLQEIQLNRSKKIITLERPIEFLYGTKGKSLVTQREIGRDARSFSSSLTSAMRQAPNIIMVGEVRNRVEVNELLRAAETGHLTISTMHTNSAATTINRIKSLYEGDDQLRILASLSDVARGFANQVLIKTKDKKGRFAVREELNVDEDVAKLIHEGDVQGIRDYQIERGITMEHEIVKAVVDGKCDIESAREQSRYPRLFDKILEEQG